MSRDMNKYSHYDYQPSLETCIEGSFESEDHTATDHESDMDEQPLQPKRFFLWRNVFCDPFRGDVSSSNINSQAFRTVAPSSISTTNVSNYYVHRPQDAASTSNVTELYSSSIYSWPSVVPSTTTEIIIMERGDQLLTSASADTNSDDTQTIQSNRINSSNANVAVSDELRVMSSSTTTTTFGTIVDSSSNLHINSTEGDLLAPTLEHNITLHNSSTANHTASSILPTAAATTTTASDTAQNSLAETNRKRGQLFIASSALQILFFFCLLFFVVCYYYYYIYHQLLHREQRQEIPSILWQEKANKNIQIKSQQHQQQQQSPDYPVVEDKCQETIDQTKNSFSTNEDLLENLLKESKVMDESRATDVTSEETIQGADAQIYNSYSTNFLQQQQQQNLTTNESGTHAITPPYQDSNNSAESLLLQTDTLQQLNDYPALHSDKGKSDAFSDVVTAISVHDEEIRLDVEERTYVKLLLVEDGTFSVEEYLFHDQSETNDKVNLGEEPEVLHLVEENNNILKELQITDFPGVDSKRHTTPLTYDKSGESEGEESISDPLREQQHINRISTLHEDKNGKHSKEFLNEQISHLEMSIPSDGEDIMVSHLSSTNFEKMMDNSDSIGFLTSDEESLIESLLSEETPSDKHNVGNSFVTPERIENKIINDAGTFADTQQNHGSGSSCLYSTCYASTNNGNDFLLATRGEEYPVPVDEDHDTIEAVIPFSNRASSFFVSHKRPELVQNTFEEGLYPDILEEDDDGETTYIVVSSFMTDFATKSKLIIQKLSLVPWDMKHRSITLAMLKKIPPFFLSKVKELVGRVHDGLQVIQSKDKVEVLHDVAKGIRYETKLILNKIEPLQRELQQRVSNVDVKKLPLKALTTIKMHIEELNEREDSYDD